MTKPKSGRAKKHAKKHARERPKQQTTLDSDTHSASEIQIDSSDQEPETEHNLDEPTSSKEGSRLLALPGEIRNRILKYALVPVDRSSSASYEIAPCGESAPRCGFKGPAAWLDSARSYCSSNGLDEITASWYDEKPKASWPLLATCKQLAREGVGYLYADNVIHLAPGDLNNSLLHLEKLQPSIMLMKQVCLDISFADLDQDVLNYINQQVHLASGNPLIRAMDRRSYITSSLWALRNLWASKLAYINTLKHLEKLIIRVTLPEGPFSAGSRPRIRTPKIYDELIIKGRDFPEALRNLHPNSTFPFFDRRGLLSPVTDSYYKNMDEEVGIFFAQVLRRFCHKLGRAVLKAGLHDLDPWLRGLVGHPCEATTWKRLKRVKVWGGDWHLQRTL